MIQPLSALPRDSLRALAAALTGGSLRAPFALASVARAVGSGAHLEPVAEALRRLDSDGMAARHLALLLEALAAERDAACQEEDRVQLVWTGPEAAPRDRDTGVVAAWLFRVVQRDLLVCSFALGYSGGLFDALAARMDEEPDLRVHLFVNVHRPPNDSTASDDLVRRFAHEFRTRLWPGKRLPEVWYDPRSLEPDSHRRAVLHVHRRRRRLDPPHLGQPHRGRPCPEHRGRGAPAGSTGGPGGARAAGGAGGGGGAEQARLRAGDRST